MASMEQTSDCCFTNLQLGADVWGGKNPALIEILKAMSVIKYRDVFLLIKRSTIINP